MPVLPVMNACDECLFLSLVLAVECLVLASFTLFMPSFDDCLPDIN